MSRRPRAKRRRRLKPASPRVAGEGVRYPFVALLGRPNTGKSTLFNRLVGQRLAITEPTAGTTRDRIAALVELEDGRTIELCDMGGAGGTGGAHDRDIDAQIDLAVDYADLLLFVVDARAGQTPLDEQLAKRVLRLGKPVVLVANKAETRDLELAANEFYALGLPGDPVCISAKEGEGRSDLLERVGEVLDALAPAEGEAPAEESAAEPDVLRLAIVGRRNVGKSTYVNALCGAERVIASEEAGTTRDAVDVEVEVDGRPVVLIDTAGLRKRGRAEDHIEIISHDRTLEAVRRADVVLLLLDCLDDVSQVDKKLAGAVAEEHKACVIVANKWDLVEERMTVEQYADYVGRELPGLSHAPVVCMSAREGLHATSPVQVAFDLRRQASVRVGTGELNRVVAEAVTRRRPRPRRGRLGKVFFCTQVAIRPPTILVFVNEPELFDRSWRRYLAGHLREVLPWDEVPVKLCFRARQSLARKGGGLARRVEGLGGLAERARVLDLEEQGAGRAAELAPELDAEDVEDALLDAFGDSEDPQPAEEAP